MKKIEFKTPGAMLERSPDGKLIRRAFNAAAELPFSESNLLQAESKGLPGSAKILKDEDILVQNNAPREGERSGIWLTDRVTGNPVELYVENGQLMMEVR